LVVEGPAAREPEKSLNAITATAQTAATEANRSQSPLCLCKTPPHIYHPMFRLHRRGMAPETFVGLAGRLVQMIGMIGNLATPNQIPSTPLAGRFALSSPNSVERQRGTAGSAVALKIVTAHSRSAQNLGEQRGGAVLCAAARPVNIKKGIFPALASLFITLVVTPFGWADVDTIDGTVAVLPTRRDEPGPRSRTASRRQRSTMSSTASVARC